MFSTYILVYRDENGDIWASPRKAKNAYEALKNEMDIDKNEGWTSEWLEVIYVTYNDRNELNKHIDDATAKFKNQYGGTKW